MSQQALEREEEVLALCRSHDDGITQDGMGLALPNLSVTLLSECLNSLLSKASAASAALAARGFANSQFLASRCAGQDTSVQNRRRSAGAGGGALQVREARRTSEVRSPAQPLRR